MEPTSKKKPLKFDIGKQHIFEDDFQSNFHHLGLQKSTQNQAFFRILIENVDFAKIIVFPRENCYVSNPEPQKMKQKSMPECDQKTYRKKARKNWILASILASKILENHSKKRCETKPVSRSYANHPEIVAS